MESGILVRVRSPHQNLVQPSKILYHHLMATVTKTLQLPFQRLNQTKAEEFARLQELNTAVANVILTLPKSDRRMLTSKSFAQIKIGSAWINQTIRNANAKTKVKQFKCLPLETNNQNWTLQLEQFVGYKATLAGVVVEKVPAAYTSKTYHACGHLNSRKKHAYRCEYCGRQAHADGNAAQNIRDYEGLCCPWVLEAPTDGPHDLALNRVREAAGV
jgi:transposase